MGFREIVIGLYVGLVLEPSAQKKSLEEFATQFAEAGNTQAQRFEQATPKPIHHRQMRHVIGIERWGQRRLRVALGEPAIDDEYDNYQPPKDASWEALVEAFRDTRQTTVDLIRAITTRSTDNTLIRHNDLGPLSVRAWLSYLKAHATRETLMIR